jgi:hypothetical protein
LTESADSKSTQQIEAPSTNRLCALALAVLTLLAVVHFLGMVSFIPSALSGRAADFRGFYVAGYMLRTGQAHSLYNFQLEKEFQDRLVSPELTVNPLTHPPYEAILFAPFSYLSFRAAYLTFAVFNLTLLAAIFPLVRSYFGDLDGDWRWLPLATMAGFLPLYLAVMQDQDSILLLAIFSATGLLLAQRKDATAGALLAAGLFKFQLVLPFVLLYLLWRRWRFICAFAACGSAIVAFCVWMVGIDGARSYVATLLTMSTRSVTPAQQASVALFPVAMANLRGLVTNFGLRALSPATIQIVVLCASIVAVILAATRRPSFSLAVSTSILVAYHLYPHDLSLLLLPVGCAVHAIRESSKGRNTAGIVLIALLVGGPTALLLFGGRIYLLSIVLIAFLLWQMTSKISGDDCPQRMTTVDAR